MSRSEECARVEALLPDWLLGELEPPAAAQVQAHVAQCAHCSSEVSRWQRLEDELAAVIPAAAHQLPPGLTARMTAAVAAEEVRQQRSQRQTRALVAGAVLFAGALAAAAAVLVVGALAAAGPMDLPGLVDWLAVVTGSWLPVVLCGLGGVAICALLLWDDLERLLLPRAVPANSTEVEVHVW